MSPFQRVGLLMLLLVAHGCAKDVHRSPAEKRPPVVLQGEPFSGFMEIEGTKTLNDTFKGGQRACFIALATPDEDKPPYTITVTVYDPQGKVVGSDDGKRAAVIWYPPRDGEYRIEIRSSTAEERVCYIAVK